MVPTMIVLGVFFLAIYLLLSRLKKKEKKGPKSSSKREGGATQKQASTVGDPLEPSITNEEIEKLERNLAKKKVPLVGEVCRLASAYVEKGKSENAVDLYHSIASNPEFLTDKTYIPNLLQFSRLSFEAKEYEVTQKMLKAVQLMDSESPELLYQMGLLSFVQKKYGPAFEHFSRVSKNPAFHKLVAPYLGLCFYYRQQYTKAIPYFKESLDSAFNAEVLYASGDSFYNTSNGSVNYAKLLEPICDLKEWGLRANLLVAKTFIKKKQMSVAQEYLEKSLSFGEDYEALSEIEQEESIETRYLLAKKFLHENAVDSAVPLLTEIDEKIPDYKDVKSLLEKYGQILKNPNLNRFLNGSSAEATSVVQRFINHVNPGCEVTVLECVFEDDDIRVGVQLVTRGWEKTVCYLFSRGQGDSNPTTVGAFFEWLKDSPYESAFYYSAGNVSADIRSTFEMRPIDFFTRDQFQKLLAEVPTQ